MIMTIDSQNLLESILKSLDRIDYIRPEDIPGIDLYMDQVTTFMDSQLSSSRRYEDDKRRNIPGSICCFWFSFIILKAFCP